MRIIIVKFLKEQRRDHYALRIKQDLMHSPAVIRGSEKCLAVSHYDTPNADE